VKKQLDSQLRRDSLPLGSVGYNEIKDNFDLNPDPETGDQEKV